MRRLLLLPLTALATLTAFCAQAPPEPSLEDRARAIHDRVITLDTHVDINPRDFTAERNYTQRLESQVNLPKMKEGGLDAAFLIVYVGQGSLTPEGYDRAYTQAIEKFEAIHRLTEQIAPEQIELALTAADVRRINAAGKKVALIGVENAYPLGTDLSRVKEFYDRGGRYMSLAHNGHSQFADSNTGERDSQWMHNGLNELGRQVIVEMNRLGMMVDVSHPSKQSNLQAIKMSKAPVIASHSSARAIADHSRNMDDEQLEALKANGGVIQTVAFDGYVKIKPPDSPERAAAIAKLRLDMGLQGGPQTQADATRNEFRKRMAALDEQFPPAPMATVSEFVDHIDYLVKKVGIDHVGISSDFDGGGGVEGWNGAEETFNVTLELVRRGYTEEQIGKIWSGNLLRVMDEVQKVAREIQAGQK
ncbi:MAG: dipeptidase [Acidobacteria bacterium]|nr:dipeptidase [Acidobacteriota bacterium]